MAYTFLTLWHLVAQCESTARTAGIDMHCHCFSVVRADLETNLITCMQVKMWQWQSNSTVGSLSLVWLYSFILCNPYCFLTNAQKNHFAIYKSTAKHSLIPYHKETRNVRMKSVCLNVKCQKTNCNEVNELTIKPITANWISLMQKNGFGIPIFKILVLGTLL